MSGIRYSKYVALHFFTIVIQTRLLSVRQAVESIAKIAQVLNKEQIEHFYLPMTKRLSSGDWFTSRTSACSMFSPIYSRSSAIIQEELRKYGNSLLSDIHFNAEYFRLDYLLNYAKMTLRWFVEQRPRICR